jgi:hypothetical protein
MKALVNYFKPPSSQAMQTTPKAFARHGGQAEQARWSGI